MITFPTTGTQWSQMTHQYSGPTTGSHEANTRLDITGTGVLVGLWDSSGGSTAVVEVDGSATYLQFVGGSASPQYGFMIPFAQSIKVTANATSAQVLYLLD